MASSRRLRLNCEMFLGSNLSSGRLCGGSKVIKLFFMLNLAETKIYPAHKILC